MRRRSFFMVTLLIVILSVGLNACASPAGPAQPELKLAPESALPDFVQDAPPQVKEAYRFAIANQDYLANFPCYCGCSSVGHKSNLQCYIKGTNPDGSLVFDDHAFA